jgi:hypothetical protein
VKCETDSILEFKEMFCLSRETMTNTTERPGYLFTGFIDWIVGIFAPCLALKRKRARAELKALEAEQGAETGGAQRSRDTGGWIPFEPGGSPQTSPYRVIREHGKRTKWLQ